MRWMRVVPMVLALAACEEADEGGAQAARTAPPAPEVTVAPPMVRVPQSKATGLDAPARPAASAGATTFRRTEAEVSIGA